MRLSDEDGDGRAGACREPLYGKFGSDDTHGMTNNFTWGFDGWIYACHGFRNKSEVRGRDGQVMELHSGSTYRMRADGSHVEVFTHGLVNPFGLTLDPRGDLYTCDSESRPIFSLLRGSWYQNAINQDDGMIFGPSATTDQHLSSAIAKGLPTTRPRSSPSGTAAALFLGNPGIGLVHCDFPEWRGSSLAGDGTHQLPQQ